MSDLKAELERLQAEKAQFDAELAAKEEEEELAIKVAQATRELADMKAMRAAEESHGRFELRKIAAVKTEEGVVIVKKPNHVIYKKFRDTNEFDTEALFKLVKTCLVHPDLPKFEKLLEERPAVLERAANAVIELAGHNRKLAEGK